MTQELICTHKGCKKPQIADCEFCADHAPKVEKKGKEIVTIQKNTPELLIAQAIDKGVPVETMERLMNMRRELKAEQANEAYNVAMAKFQSECPVIVKNKSVKNKDGKSVRYSYAPLEEIVKQIKDTIKNNGFSYRIDSQVEDQWVTAICKITHEMGHSETSTFKVPVDKDSFMSQPQKFASALTFAKRYAFCEALGILTADDDDDANHAAQEDAKKDKTQKEFEILLGSLKRVKTEKTLREYRKMMEGSKKYTDEQKKEFIDKVDELLKQFNVNA